MDRRHWLTQCGWLSFGIAMCGCRSAPVTGRRQLMLMPENSEQQLGLQAYEESTGNVARSQNQRAADMVQRVGQRIADVSGRNDYQWEFRLLATDEQNAFCLPGGKVAVHEGILPVCVNEAGLAVVMSHEVAHALARHGGERMSQGYAVDGVQKVVQYAMQGQSETRRDTLLKAYGVASKYGVILPYSRQQESEADQIGLTLMARAGYDPEEAPRFWQRFAGDGTKQQQPEFMSTHPTDVHRAAALQQLLPGAQTLYGESPQHYGLGEPLV